MQDKRSLGPQDILASRIGDCRCARSRVYYAALRPGSGRQWGRIGRSVAGKCLFLQPVCSYLRCKLASGFAWRSSQHDIAHPARRLCLATAHHLRPPASEALPCPARAPVQSTEERDEEGPSQSEQHQPQAHPRFSRSHGHQERPGRSESPPRQRPPPHRHRLVPGQTNVRCWCSGRGRNRSSQPWPGLWIASKAGLLGPLVTLARTAQSGPVQHLQVATCKHGRAQPWH